MPVITIRGQTGSGSREIGREVARMIKCDYVDRQVLEHIALQVGLPVAQIEEKEQIPGRLVQRILSSLQGAVGKYGTDESAYSHTWREPLDDASYLYALESVIQDLALEANIIIVGRGSQFILRHHPSALHVLVIAPLSERVKRVVAELNMSEEQARKHIDEADSSRRAFIKRFFKRKLEQPEHYDLMVNTGRLAIEAAARIVVAAATEKAGSRYI